MARKLNLLVIAILIGVFSTSATASVISTEAWEGTPVEFGLRDLNKALADMPDWVEFSIAVAGEETASNAARLRRVLKALSQKAESFVIARVGNNIVIIGRDQVGAMYGCFEMAERLNMKGRLALVIREPIVQSPAVEFRAVNQFLSLPYKEVEKDWWFLQEDYWGGFLDQLAHARINWMDLHGMYDIKTTLFPNIYPYFITSDQFPEIGVEPAIAKRNLDMLNKIIGMAKQRGIKVALMSYAATWDSVGLRKSPYPNTEENLSAYTREVVRKMIQSCPDLAMIGFRIGESGKSEHFFKDSYIPAIAEAGRPIDLYCRTWVARKPPILEIGKQFPGHFLIEIKYNGEQFGPPYIVAGGRVTGWGSYSYQDYYSYPKNYKIIYQLRANGTHRVFPWGNPKLAARANESSLLGGAVGLCIEPMDAYYPKYESRHKDDSPNKWYKWQYQRDWYWYQVWGRTAYTPALKDQDELWINMFAQRFGESAAGDIYQAMNWASMILSDAYTAYALGPTPDHRYHASELELGGTIKNWAEGQPFDLQNIQSPYEYADRLKKKNPSARVTPIIMANYLNEESDKTRQYLDLVQSKVSEHSPEINDLTVELRALSYLGDYYSHKLTAATYFALMRKFSDVELAPRVREELEKAHEAWNMVAKFGEENYKPFIDRLRMGTNNYTWAEEGKKLKGDFEALDKAAAAIRASGKAGHAPSLGIKGDGKGPVISDVKSKIIGNDGDETKKLVVTVKVKDTDGVAKVLLKTKNFPSERSWSTRPMTVHGGVYTGEKMVFPEGLMWCIETLDKQGNGTLWPDFRFETPYRVVPPWEYQASKADVGQALKTFDKIKPSRRDYSFMIVGKDALAISSTTKEVRDSILESVKNGLSLIVLYQSAPEFWDSGWLGGVKCVKAETKTAKLIRSHTITRKLPEHIQTNRLVTSAFEGGEPEWFYLSEPKIMAVRNYGSGHIILIQTDLCETLTGWGVGKLIGNIIKYAKWGSTKPALVIDPGDGSVFTLLSYYESPWLEVGKAAYR